MPAKKKRAKINVVFYTCNVRSGGIGRLSGSRTAIIAFRYEAQFDLVKFKGE